MINFEILKKGIEGNKESIININGEDMFYIDFIDKINKYIQKYKTSFSEGDTFVGNVDNVDICAIFALIFMGVNVKIGEEIISSEVVENIMNLYNPPEFDSIRIFIPPKTSVAMAVMLKHMSSASNVRLDYQTNFDNVEFDPNETVITSGRIAYHLADKMKSNDDSKPSIYIIDNNSLSDTMMEVISKKFNIVNTSYKSGITSIAEAIQGEIGYSCNEFDINKNSITFQVICDDTERDNDVIEIIEGIVSSMTFTDIPEDVVEEFYNNGNIYICINGEEAIRINFNPQKEQ